MNNLTTNYIGLNLKSPVIVSSNPLCANHDTLIEMEKAGAGAVILPSLFEEQVALYTEINSPYSSTTKNNLPESLQYLADIADYNHGISGYLALIRSAKDTLDIPVIASLNGTTPHGWTKYAYLMERAGADAIELNLYEVSTDAFFTGEEIESTKLKLVEQVRGRVSVPLIVKLSPFYSSLPNFIEKLEKVGVNAISIFNRFYQPDINLESETVTPTLKLSSSEELRLRLRWAALLSPQTSVEIGITGGIHSGGDVLKSILAGGQVAMVASAVVLNGVEIIARILSELEILLEQKGYQSIDAIRGKLNASDAEITLGYERANYIQVLDKFRQNSS